MKIQKMAITALSALALVGATLTFTMNSHAQGETRPEQGPPPAQAGPRNPGGPPGFGQAGPGAPGQAPGQFRQGGGGQFGGGGGGGTAMDSDNSFLYIVQGNMLFKVSKGDLRIQGSTPLMQMPQGGPQGGAGFAPGQPGQRPPGGPGGGSVPPPTKD